MIPQPATGGPPIKSIQGAAAVNLDNDSINDLTKSFASALKPLVDSVNKMGDVLAKSMAPDPEDRLDRGKDLIKEEGSFGTPDPKVMDITGGGFLKAALLVLGASLLGFAKELQGIVNLIAFPRIIKAVKIPFVLIGKGFDIFAKGLRGIGKGLDVLAKQVQNRSLRQAFGKGGPINRFILGLGNLARSIRNFKLGDSIKGFMKGGAISNFFTRITSFTKSFKAPNISLLKTQAAFGKGGALGKFFLTFGNLTTRIKNFVAPIGKLFGLLGSILKPIGSLLKGAGALLKPLLPLVKMFALPITIIMGVIDGIKGFVEGYKDGGFLDGIFTAIGSVLGGLVGAPLDLLKNALAFILDKVGLKGVAEALKEFSFKDFIKSAFGGIANFFEKLPGFIEGAIRSIPKVGNKIADFIFGKTVASETAAGDETIKLAEDRRKEIDDLEKKKAEGTLSSSEIKRLGALKRGQKKLEGKAEEAALENIGLKTADAGLQEKVMGGMSTEEILASEDVKKLGLSDTELGVLKKAVGGMQQMDQEELFKSSFEQQKAKAERLDLKDGPTDSALSEEIAREEFKAKVAEAQLAKMEAPPPQEGEALGAQGAPPVVIAGGGGSQDNSQNDNSQNTTNQSITNNNYGGSDGASFNSKNNDGSLFNQQGTYAGA